MERYFVIYQPEADYVSLDEISKQELEKRLAEKYWGEKPSILDHLPGGMEGCLEEQGLVIIKGSVVVPKPVKVIERYEVE